MARSYGSTTCKDDRMSADSGFQIEGDASTHYQAQIERFMAPFVERLVDSAVGDGDVLDVACGTGFATRAARAETGGRVAGLDLNEGIR
jgi:SAM-dependent methyltransferase